MSLSLENQLLEGALRSLADGLVVVDAAGRIAFWNARAEEFFGLHAGEWQGADVEGLYRALAGQTDDPDKRMVQFQEGAAALDKTPPVDFTVSRPRPRTIAAQWFDLQDDSGRGQGYGILFRDVTREKELDQMKNQLLSIVSHELRTPLAAIKGFATTLLRDDVSWDEATQRDFIKIIDEESDRLGELIDNLLDMSQAEAGILRIDREPVHLRNLVREAKDRVARRSETHWFVVDLPSHLPRVWADPRRVRQVLNNLLENAIKYSPGGGQITITCEVEGEHVVVSVADQGPGIPPEYLDRIFERFFQVDSKSTRKTGGIGLGLSIVKGIVEAHGGRIWAESTPGQGSIFRFTLPFVPESESMLQDDRPRE
ncbi:MAG: ATP-binding protein [Anaerolineae bacterium]